MNDLLKLEINQINKLRNQDSEIGALVNDVVDYCLREDYKHAMQASAYLFLALAKRASIKPYTALRGIYKMSRV